jgi:hypothetical protein
MLAERSRRENITTDKRCQEGGSWIKKKRRGKGEGGGEKKDIRTLRLT